MDLFTYLMAKNDHNTSVNKDLFSYLLGKGQSGNYQTFTGTSISANNTKKAKMKLSLKGNTSQDTTTGKNLFNGALFLNATDWNMSNGYYTGNIKDARTYFENNPFYSSYEANTQYTISWVGYYTTASNVRFRIYYTDSTNDDVAFLTSSSSRVSGTSALGKTIDHIELTFGGQGIVFIKDIQLEKNSTLTDYEPYTGGQPSPSPSYPQPINVVSGDNTIIVCGENLAYDTWASDFVSRINDNTKAKLETVDSKNCLYYKASAGYGEYDTKYMFKTNWKENTQYTFSMNLKPSVANEVNLAIAYTDNTSQTISATISANTWKHINFTSIDNKTIKYLQVHWSSGYCYIDLDTYQVEEGNTETSYKKIGISYPINLPVGMELCKIGTYQDYFTKNSGKNLFNGIMELGIYDGDTGQPVANTSYMRTKNFILVEELTEYVINSIDISAGLAVYEYKEDYTYNLTSNKVLSNGQAFTTERGTKYIKFRPRTANTNLSSRFMVNEGSTLLPYEPYGTGQWCKYNAIGKYIFTNEETLEYYGVNGAKKIANKISGLSYDSNDIPLGYSSISIMQKRAQIFMATVDGLSYNNNEIFVHYSNKTTQQMLDIIKNTPLYYVLATPYLSLIEDDTLISQLDNIQNAMSYKGQTNISQVNNDLPFEMEAEIKVSS